MSTVTERIANLPPEKREILLQRLREQFAIKVPREAAPPPPEQKRKIVPGAETNTRLDIPQPGLLDSLAWRTLPRQAPGPGEVEIQVHAASLNFRDVMIGLGIYPTPPGVPPVMGSDCAGTIVALGEGVEGLRVGDEVIALCSNCYSGFVTAAAHTVVPKPSNLTFEQAATIPTVYVTNWYALNHLARLSRGERLLVHSACGGIGLAAIQMARALGAEVIATVGTPEKREFLQALGVEHIFNSRSLEWADDVMKLPEGSGVDVVLNSLAGEAIPKGLSILRPLGRFIELGKRDIYADSPIGLRPFYKGLSYFAIELSPLIKLRPAVFRDLFLQVVERFEQEIFKPLPQKVFSASDAADAFKYMAQGVHIGKIVLTIKDQPVWVLSDAT
ncbi:MAG TPA: zinc-binding dehydrogenase [Pyrinomonadaceae bacterium]|jgi:NADPH:quinone reductase-like Zn-dependent oxidoreductase